MEQKYVDDIQAALKDFPSLTLSFENDLPVINGHWDVVFQGDVFETYDIKITFDNDYPASLPKVYETSNKIKHEPDMHFNPPDWHACLFVSHQRWEVWPPGTEFKKFLEIPVHNYFLGQAHVAAHGYWPNRRERGHGNKGIIEYYKEKFKIDDPTIVLDLLRATQELSIPLERKCPCNHNNSLRECHGETVTILRERQDPKLLNDAIEIFSAVK